MRRYGDRILQDNELRMGQIGPVVKFPCGKADESRGNLWAWKRHAENCGSKHCVAWFQRFTNMRETLMKVEKQDHEPPPTI